MKKLLSILVCILILACSFCMSVFALDVTFNPGVDLYPIWNLSRIEVTYKSGEVAVFELPLNWFSTSHPVSNTIITLESLSGDPNTIQLSNLRFLTTDSAGGYFFVFDLFTGMATTIDFIFGDTIIPYISYGGAEAQFTPIMISNSGVNTDGRFNFGYMTATVSSDGSEGRSYGSYGSTSIDNLYEFNDGPPVLDGDPQNSGYFCLTPNNDWIHFLSSLSTNLSSGALRGKYLHFFNMSVTASIDNKSFVEILIPLTTEDYRVNFYDYIKSTFPGTIYTGVTNLGFDDLGEFLATSLGGFFNFEPFPNISIGDMFMTVIGVALVILFLKFFAGG